MSTDKIVCLLNWHATAYHLPLFLAQGLGYFADEGIKIAILEPNDPSDVTELIGSGYAQLGVKALIHTLAGKARGFPIKSIGSLVNEPFTGLLYLKGGGVTQDFKSLKHKKIGYVGEFGKIQIDELTRFYGMTPDDYTTVRCGMNISKALIEGTIDAGVGLENIQQVELEQWCLANGRPATDVGMQRVDELAQLGCCCFCSILFIGNEDWLASHPMEAASFMRAIKRGTDAMLADPAKAWKQYCNLKPAMKSSLCGLQYERSFNYMSQDHSNVLRDWKKVTAYAQRLGVVPDDFKMNMTNQYLSWPLQDSEAVDGAKEQAEMIIKQASVALNGGVLSGCST